MKYVIKFDNGSYNLGYGHEATLEECTKYDSRTEAEIKSSTMYGVDSIEKIDDSTVISKDAIIQAIEKATVTMTILVPCRDYYARENDTEKRNISYIDPQALISALADI